MHRCHKVCVTARIWCWGLWGSVFLIGFLCLGFANVDDFGGRALEIVSGKTGVRLGLTFAFVPLFSLPLSPSLASPSKFSLFGAGPGSLACSLGCRRAASQDCRAPPLCSSPLLLFLPRSASPFFLVFSVNLSCMHSRENRLGQSAS